MIANAVKNTFKDNGTLLPKSDSTPKEKAYIDMWNRRLELDALSPLGYAARNKVAFFADRVLAGTRNDIKQSQDIVEYHFFHNL